MALFRGKPTVTFDIGGSLAKLLVFEPNNHEQAAFITSRLPPGDAEFESAHFDGKFRLYKFSSASLDECLMFVKKYELNSLITNVTATGGGAFRYSQLIEDQMGVAINQREEMTTLVLGLNFVLNEVPNSCFVINHKLHEIIPLKTFLPPSHIYPYLLVSFGSGVSFLLVEGFDRFSRVSGTCLGGATFLALAKLLTGETDFDRIIELTTAGDYRNCDLLIRDIYGGAAEGLNIDPDLPAASFGSLFRKEHTKNDILRSLMFMVCINVAHLASHAATSVGAKDIVFCGHFLGKEKSHTVMKETLSFGIDFYSGSEQRAVFIRHHGFLGALGAFVQHHPSHTELLYDLHQAFVRRTTPNPTEGSLVSSISSESIHSEDDGVINTMPEISPFGSAEIMRPVSLSPPAHLQ
ncbi:hypothetical protein PCE1_003922 [Barthelona sp. PCE]